MARRVAHQLPTARFLIVGDGPCRAALEQLAAASWALSPNVMFLGSRDDVPRLLAAMDVFALTSHIEANPISILEAMSVGPARRGHQCWVDSRSGDRRQDGISRPAGRCRCNSPSACCSCCAIPLAAAAMGTAARTGRRRTLVDRGDGRRLRATDRVDLCQEGVSR